LITSTPGAHGPLVPGPSGESAGGGYNTFAFLLLTFRRGAVGQRATPHFCLFTFDFLLFLRAALSASWPLGKARRDRTSSLTFESIEQREHHEAIRLMARDAAGTVTVLGCAR
jgi:hypothetical protein